MAENLKFIDRIHQLEATIESKTAQLRDLATMGAVITSMHEIDAVLSVVMDMAVRLVDGEVGLIMIHEQDQLKMKVSWGVDDRFVKNLIYKDDMDIATYCYTNREPVILSDMNLKTENNISLNAIMAQPIQTKQKCLGVIIIINKADGGNFFLEDKEVLEMLLNYVAVAVDNSILIKDKLRQQKIEQDLAIARQIQETLLPQNIDSFNGVDIGAVYFPAREVSGDFYEILKIDDKKFIAVLGDVSNKGVPAAMVMSATAAIIKSLINFEPNIEIANLAGKLNDLLVTEIIREREMFVTMFMCKFDLDAGQLTYCNAGHIPGLFWDQQAKQIKELPEGGPIVGQFPGIQFKQGSCPISSGDRLFLFTDGLTEAADTENNLFGRERVEQVYISEIGSSPKEFCLKVKGWVDKFTEGTDDDSWDDFTIMQIMVE